MSGIYFIFNILSFSSYDNYLFTAVVIIVACWGWILRSFACWGSI